MAGSSPAMTAEAPRREAPTGIAIESQQRFTKNRIRARSFSVAEHASAFARCAARLAEGKKLALEAREHNPRREFGGRRIFYFFARNPLKSPDSKKLVQGNESLFPFISLHLFSFPYPGARALVA
jgi:hypothetical protein